MQPYFFPYLGQLQLIHSVDKWIALDTVQYIRHGWMNRNRILHPSSGWQYVTLPIQKHAKACQIKDIVISQNFDYRSRILAQLEHYRGKAPYFEQTRQLLDHCLDGQETSLSIKNVAILQALCDLLQIDFDYAYLSESDVYDARCEPDKDPGKRVLNICKSYRATEYISPAGGMHLLDANAFLQAGITLKAQKYRSLIYATGSYIFQPDLSVIDVLCWNTPEEILRHLESHG